MNGGADIGRIVSLIMENPKLIEEISSLAKADSAERGEQPAPPVTDEMQGKPSDTMQDNSATVRAASEPASRMQSEKNRSHLLAALKPYVSRERAQAIDSMLTVVEILDAMKRR